VEGEGLGGYESLSLEIGSSSLMKKKSFIILSSRITPFDMGGGEATGTEDRISWTLWRWGTVAGDHLERDPD